MWVFARVAPIRVEPFTLGGEVRPKVVPPQNYQWGCLTGPRRSKASYHFALVPVGTWCSGITSASHAEGPGFNPQCVQLCLCVLICFPEQSLPSWCVSDTARVAVQEGLHAAASANALPSKRCAKQIPPVGLEPTIFGLEVQRLVH